MGTDPAAAAAAAAGHVTAGPVSAAESEPRSEPAVTGEIV